MMENDQIEYCDYDGEYSEYKCLSCGVTMKSEITYMFDWYDGHVDQYFKYCPCCGRKIRKAPWKDEE